MGSERETLKRLATDLTEDMERQYGQDAELTAVLAVAAVKAADGSVYIQYRAADGDGDALPPWHVNGVLRYLLAHSESRDAPDA